MYKHVIIIGGGFGGIKTALGLADKPDFKVTLISSTAHFEYHGALYRAATGHSPREVVMPLADIFRSHKNVEVVLGKAVSLDAKAKFVTLESGERWFYDELVLAMGNQKNFFNIPGMAEHSSTMYTIGDTIELRAKLVKLFSGHKRHLRITVVGGGPSGIELAGELHHFARQISTEHHRSIPVLDVQLLEAGPRLLPMLSEKVSLLVTKKLAAVGVRVSCSVTVQTCDGHKICANSHDHQADLVIWTAGTRPVDFYSLHPKVFKLSDRGRVIVNHHLQAANHIYVIGDNADCRYSGMAQTAIHQGEYLANYLAGRTSRQYADQAPTYVIPVGPKWAIVQLPSGKVRYGRYGWAVRRQADKWVISNFEPYRRAIWLWRQGDHRVRLPFSLHYPQS